MKEDRGMEEDRDRGREDGGRERDGGREDGVKGQREGGQRTEGQRERGMEGERNGRRRDKGGGQRMEGQTDKGKEGERDGAKEDRETEGRGREGWCVICGIMVSDPGVHRPPSGCSYPSKRTIPTCSVSTW